VRRAIFLEAARDDLLVIFENLAKVSGSVSVARNFVLRLRDKCNKLAAFENVMGRARPELRADVRSFPYKNYVIFLRYVGERFEVINIIEGHRDLEALFEKDDH
jgi:plasmid stabilization system protein ParE